MSFPSLSKLKSASVTAVLGSQSQSHKESEQPPQSDAGKRATLSPVARERELKREQHQLQGEVFRSKSGCDEVFKLELDDRQKRGSAMPEYCLPFRSFLKSHSCYEMIPASGKVIVLDVSLRVRSAFQALMENDVICAPLWDSKLQEITGMITVTDFIDILRKFYSIYEATGKVNVMNRLQRYRIEEGRKDVDRTQKAQSLIHVNPDDSIFDACMLLLQNNIPTLPIMDEENNSVLHVISHIRILNFLWTNMESPPSFLHRAVGELSVGTFTNVVTTLIDTPLIILLDLLSERNISAVPLVDETGVVKGIYAKSDVATLAEHENLISKMDMPVQETIPKSVLMEVHTCHRTDSLWTVINSLVQARLRRIVCVDSTNRIEGIISLSDVLRYLLCPRPR